MIVGVFILLVSVVPSLHRSAELGLWNVEDAYHYVTSPTDEQFTPRADAFNKCKADFAYLVPKNLTMDYFKGSDRWYVTDSSWSDGTPLPEKTYSFKETSLPDGTILYSMVSSSYDSALSYQKNLYDSRTGSFLRTQQFNVRPYLIPLPETLDVLSSVRASQRMVFNISSYDVLLCEE